MKTTAGFGAVLAGIRRRQGFQTPYAFYRGRGGRRELGLSFANYLRLERGKGLPKGWRLERIVSALGLEPAAADTVELVLAYCRETLGSQRLAACLEAAAGPDPAPESWLLSESAARQAIAQRAVQLSLEQYKVVSGDSAVYACHAILANTLGWVESAQLAKATGLAPAKVAKAVSALVSARLAQRSGRRVRSPLAGKYVTPPALTPALMSVYGKLRGFRGAWIRGQGRLVHSPYLVLRARRGQFARFLKHLSDVVAMSAVYGDVHPAPDSEMYLVEGNVFRLFR